MEKIEEMDEAEESGLCSSAKIPRLFVGSE
jgi:hypothetical protein